MPNIIEVNPPPLYVGLRCWVASIDERPVGCVTVGREGMLRMIFVAAEARPQRVADDLIAHAKQAVGPLVHDGELSPAGQKLVQRHGIPRAAHIDGDQLVSAEHMEIMGKRAFEDLRSCQPVAEPRT